MSRTLTPTSSEHFLTTDQCEEDAQPTDPTILALIEELECGMCAGLYIDVRSPVVPWGAKLTLPACRTEWLWSHVLRKLRRPMDQCKQPVSRATTHSSQHSRYPASLRLSSLATLSPTPSRVRSAATHQSRPRPHRVWPRRCQASSSRFMRGRRAHPMSTVKPRRCTNPPLAFSRSVDSTALTDSSSQFPRLLPASTRGTTGALAAGATHRETAGSVQCR